MADDQDRQDKLAAAEACDVLRAFHLFRTNATVSQFLGDEVDIFVVSGAGMRKQFDDLFQAQPREARLVRGRAEKIK